MRLPSTVAGLRDQSAPYASDACPSKLLTISQPSLSDDRLRMSSPNRTTLKPPCMHARRISSRRAGPGWKRVRQIPPPTGHVHSGTSGERASNSRRFSS